VSNKTVSNLLSGQKIQRKHYQYSGFVVQKAVLFNINYDIKKIDNRIQKTVFYNIINTPYCVYKP